MQYAIEDTRQQPVPKVKELISLGLISLDDAKDWLRTIYEIRFFEEKVFELLGQNIIKGASHLYAGEEAVATGATAAISRHAECGEPSEGPPKRNYGFGITESKTLINLCKHKTYTN